MLITRAETDKAYQEGEQARLNKAPTTTCPYSFATNGTLWGWWKAGYNDKDIQLGGSTSRSSSDKLTACHV